MSCHVTLCGLGLDECVCMCTCVCVHVHVEGMWLIGCVPAFV